jgi:hypothetical protein
MISEPSIAPDRRPQPRGPVNTAPASARPEGLMLTGKRRSAGWQRDGGGDHGSPLILVGSEPLGWTSSDGFRPASPAAGIKARRAEMPLGGSVHTSPAPSARGGRTTENHSTAAARPRQTAGDRRGDRKRTGPRCCQETGVEPISTTDINLRHAEVRPKEALTLLLQHRSGVRLRRLAMSGRPAIAAV